MPHPSDSELIPLNSKVKITRGVNKGKVAIIRKHQFQFNGSNFLHYLLEIENMKGLYAGYHEDLELVG